MEAPGVNVAYEATFADLDVAAAAAAAAAAASADFFDMSKTDFDFTHFTPVNEISSHGMTVSPRDVFNPDSIPPSTSFTNLTTPGSTYMDTPDDDYQTSPLFDNLGFEPTTQDNWFPLFPDDQPQAVVPPPAMTRTTSTSSVNQITVHPGGEGNPRKRSPTTDSPSGLSARHSSVAGVNARRRDRPLPPIVVREDDPVALKRARNTAAARKSRAKKVEERDALEAQIADLKSQVEHWKSIALGRSDVVKTEE